MKDKKRINIKIRVGYVVKAKVREMEENIRKRRIRSMRKEVVGHVQTVVGKKNILFQFKDGKMKDMSYFSL